MDTDSIFEKFLASEDALFHYTRTAIVLERILPNGMFRLSLLKDTNDPREYKFKILNMQGWSLPNGVRVHARDAHPVFDLYYSLHLYSFFRYSSFPSHR